MPEQQAIYEEQRREWHLDKRFSLGQMFLMALQIVAFVWYAAHTDAKVTATAEHQQVMDLWREKTDDERAKITSQLAVQDSQLREQADLLHRIDEKIERITTTTIRRQ